MNQKIEQYTVGDVKGPVYHMRPTPEIIIPIAGILDDTDKGIQVVVRGSNKLAWLPKRHIDYLPGAVVVPVWLARRIGGRDESIHRREMATGAVAEGNGVRTKQGPYRGVGQQNAKSWGQGPVTQRRCPCESFTVPVWLVIIYCKSMLRKRNHLAGIKSGLQGTFERISYVTIIREPNCSEGWSSDEAEVNGECPECGMPTVDGIAACGCDYSPITCQTCGHRECDGSC